MASSLTSSAVSWAADGGEPARRARVADAAPDGAHRFRVHVWCKSCRHAKDADLPALIADGRGDVPLVQMRWRYGNCGSRLTEFIVGGSHMRPGKR